MGKAPIQPEDRGATRKTTKTNKQQPWTQKRKEQYCAELAKHGRPGIAAKAVGSSRRNVIRKRQQDADFDAMCEEAMAAFKEWTIGQVQRHAWEGVNEPVFHGGQLVGVRRVHNTQLMVLEARRVVPEYREKSSVELSGDPDRPIKVKPDLGALSDEELVTFRELAVKVAAGRGDGESDDGG